MKATTATTAENNKMIAVFMGINFTDCELFTAYSEEKGFFAASIDDLKYNSSWNWLMPVIEKIDQLGASVIIGRMFCDIKYINPLNEQQCFDVRIASGVKMNAINGAVVEFIKWYTSSK